MQRFLLLQELRRCLAYRRETPEVQLQEYRLFACKVLQLCDCLVRFVFIPRGKVCFGIVFKESLWKMKSIRHFI